MSSDPASLAAYLPNYQVEKELGRGGFGIVYGGRHLRLNRPVAIKELPAWLVDNPGSRERFVTEARVLASLDHPHIVPVYDYVEQDGAVPACYGVPRGRHRVGMVPRARHQC